MATRGSKRQNLDYPSLHLANDTKASFRLSTNPASFMAAADDGGNTQPPVTHEIQSGPRFHQDATGVFQGNAHNSSLFKFKVDELLAQVRPTYGKRMTRVDHALQNLKGIIENIPSRSPVSASEAEHIQLSGQKVRIPFPGPWPGDAKYKFTYCKPSNINLVGSYARKSIVQVESQLEVDLAVTMPSDLFHEKDYLNYRYFHKRAYYLACIASGIDENSTCCYVLQYSYQNDNPLQPIIIVTPSSDGGEDDFVKSKCRIRIILATDRSIFPLTKTMADKNCIRGDGKISQEPTPFYNAVLRSECSSLAYLKLLQFATAQSAAFSDACVLGSVWLRQRGLGTGLASGGFGPFEWACTMALLMHDSGRNGIRVLSNGYSSYQMFKATLQYLSTRDLVKVPAFIESEHLDLAKANGPILFDGRRGLNILFKMSLYSYDALRHEASRTLELLSSKLVDQFDICFIRNIDEPVLKYDCLLRLPIGNKIIPNPSTVDAVDEITRLCQQIYVVLHRGLGDRVNFIDLKRPEAKPWPLGASAARYAGTGEVLVGLLLNPENANRNVDKGPSVEEKGAAADFRMFWGEKAELRRFKDGSILESLTWSSSCKKQSKLRQIVTYLFRRHIGAEAADNVDIISEKFNDFLPYQSLAESTDALTIYRPLLTAFDELQKRLQSLEGLPLRIRQITAADPSLRYTSSTPPNFDAAHSQKQPVTVYVQFEGSNRWPVDFAAVQTTKIALLLKLGELLGDSSPGLKSRLGLESARHKFANVAFLDLIYPIGPSFRLRVYHENERSLLERELKLKPKFTTDRDAAASGLAAYKRNFIQTPLHSQAVRTLSTRFPLLSPSIRLMQKWCDSHLLSRHINHELIELLTLRTFMHPEPYAVPGSIMTGFLRTILFLSQWNWQAEPFIADFSGEMTAQDIDSINTRFEAWRKIDPAMNRITMFAASNIDTEGITWTDLGPSKVLAARLTRLAKAATALVKDQSLDLQTAALFTPSLADYDFLIHLNTEVCNGGQQQARRHDVFRNLDTKDNVNSSLPGFNPVQSFLDELTGLYGSNVIFFHNADGGCVIGGLWLLQMGGGSWKVHAGFSTIIEEGEKGDVIMTHLNKTATLNDIARLGGDMVRSITPKL